MEERYHGGTAMQAECASDTRPLDTIAHLADEAERAARFINDFIDRFRGGGNVKVASGPTPVPSGHFGQLDRLRSNLSAIDAAARELNSIG